MDAFYLTVAGFCFTLIGLWYNVIQTRHADWVNDDAMRKLARCVFLSFLFPGIMSLGAALSGELKLVWQLVFVLAGVFGAISALSYLAVAQGAMRLYLLASAILYGLVVLGSFVAFFGPGLIAPLKPLQLEGALITLIMFCGVSLAWELLWKKN